jgi:hypothetical protein
MRATEFMHFINIDPKELKLGQNLKGDSYSHLTIRMVTKRARYEHQTDLRRREKEAKKAADEIRKYFKRNKK